MPIVDPEIIKSGEKELFASLLASIDEFQIEKLFQDTHKLLLKEKMQFKEGKTVVYDSQIAFQLYFSCFAQFSLLIDESGRFKGFANLNDIHLSDAEETELYEKILDSEVIKMRKAEFLDSLSASINVQTINELLNKIYKVRAVGKSIYQQGDIKVYNGHVTYQLSYEISVFFSILIDREGNYISTPLEINASSKTAE